MALKDKRALVVASGPKGPDGRINVRYNAPNGKHHDALCLGTGVIGTAPVGLAPSTATSGGTLLASTYYYRVSAVINHTETALATQVSQITTGSTSTVTLTGPLRQGPNLTACMAGPQETRCTWQKLLLIAL